MWSWFSYFAKTRICVNVFTDHGLPRWCSGKESACQCKRLWKHKRCECDSWVWKILWRRKWIPTPVFLPGKFHGERSLAGYSPWGHEESDTTECACAHTHTHTHTYSQFSVGFTLVVGKRNIFILFFFWDFFHQQSGWPLVLRDIHEGIPLFTS